MAGAKIPIFTETAIEAIALRSQGWPRVINTLTINSLLFGYQLQKEWRVWIGQQSYWTDQGYTFELRIQNSYFLAYLEKDSDWFVTLNDDACFVLHNLEVYKIRINRNEYMKAEPPF